MRELHVFCQRFNAELVFKVGEGGGGWVPLDHDAVGRGVFMAEVFHWLKISCEKALDSGNWPIKKGNDFRNALVDILLSKNNKHTLVG